MRPAHASIIADVKSGSTTRAVARSAEPEHPAPMLFALAPAVRLYYPFRHRDPRTGKWVRARYVAEPHVIAERYAEWEVTGPAEIRAQGGGGSFNPFRGPATPSAHLPIEEPPDEPPPEKPPDGDHDHPIEEPPVEDASALDELERFLLLVFLRRYVTYCARRRRFAAMNGAAVLYESIAEEIKT